MLVNDIMLAESINALDIDRVFMIIGNRVVTNSLRSIVAVEPDETHQHGIYALLTNTPAPTVLLDRDGDLETEGAWQAFTGYSNDDYYDGAAIGAVMHASETVSPGMAEIMVAMSEEQTIVWACVVVETDGEPAGWAMVYKITE